MRFLYKLISYFIYTLALFPALLGLIRGKRMWAERLGLSLPPCMVELWLHAASAGEVQLLYPLLLYLHKQRPRIKIHLSVMTQAGYNAAKSISAKQKLSYSFLPLDTGFCMRRLVHKLKPRLLVITEGEHWPNFLEAAQEADVPVILVNGRISEKSFLRLKAFPTLSRKLFEHYEILFCKSKSDKLRYLALQVPPKKAILAGDLKFDAPVTVQKPHDITALRRKMTLQKKDFLIVAGSTRPPNEERIIIDTFMQLSRKYEHLALLIAPRHLQRLPSVKNMLSKRGVKFSLYSAKGMKKNRIILVDEMGVLTKLFASADLAFVGGTMSNTGGHNILEPVWAGTPVLFGSDTANIPDLAEYVVKNNYGAQVKDAAELCRVADTFISGRRKFRRKTHIENGDSAAQKIGSHIIKNYF